MAQAMIDPELISAENAVLEPHLARDYAHLGAQLARRGIAVDAIRDRVAGCHVAVPSWGVGTGGTRFARFPGPGEPRHIFDRLEDCAVIQQLTRATPDVSLHIPWDKAPVGELRGRAESLGLGFDAVNSNTFQDQPGQRLSYKFGSLSHADPAVRAQAVEHNLDCIAFGAALGSKALTVWIGDGSNFPGQQDFTRQFDRYLDSLRAIYAGLPADWQLYTEHKMYEPAFYSTVVQDWGTSYIIVRELGPQAMCLVDLGHHAPNVNIEMIVARLIHQGKLGGFHFNDSKYGDDDLDTGSIDPYRLFLVFNELVEAEGRPGFAPAHMLDQSHNVTDPIESLMVSAMEVQRACALAALVDRASLRAAQDANDAIAATTILKTAFRTDVEPILAMARLARGGAVDPVAVYRKAGYRARIADIRPRVGGAGGGIV